MTSRQTEPERGDAFLDLPLEQLIEEAAAFDEDATPEVPAVADRPAASRHGRFEKARPAKKADKAPPAPPAEDDEGETEDEEDDEDALPTKRHPVLRGFVCAALALVLVLSLLLLAADRWLAYHYNRGKEQMTNDYDNAAIEIPENEGRVIAYDDGKTVHYNGHTYRLNENLTTLLFMGIDRKSMEETETFGTGGQADVILLITQDVLTGETKILNISRDTYAEMVLYSGEGNRLGYRNMQLCLAYAYGDGRELSCENTVAAVSKLLYGMPISQYLSIDMEGVLVANEAVGGVTVTSLHDIKLPNGTMLKTGEEIELHGKNCERYIRTRGDDMDANEARMARQKQYVQAFASTVTRQARSDLGVVTNLYHELEPYVVTSLDLSDAVFLAQTYLEHGLAFDFMSIDGSYDWLEYSEGKTSAVYYPDETSLFETVLAVYYQQVD